MNSDKSKPVPLESGNETLRADDIGSTSVEET